MYNKSNYLPPVKIFMIVSKIPLLGLGLRGIGGNGSQGVGSPGFGHLIMMNSIKLLCIRLLILYVVCYEKSLIIPHAKSPAPKIAQAK